MSGIHYIKSTARGNPVKGGSLRPRNNTGFFDGLLHHYYIERLPFCALIKHIFKTDLPKDKISCAKDFNSVHKQTLALKCSPFKKDLFRKLSSVLKIKTFDLFIINLYFVNP